MGNEEIKRELKIGILITPKEREELVTSRLYRYFCLVLRGYVWLRYGYCSIKGTAGRRMQIG